MSAEVPEAASAEEQKVSAGGVGRGPWALAGSGSGRRPAPAGRRAAPCMRGRGA